MARFVTVAAFDEVFRADVARATLEEAGITAYLTDREIVAMEWILSNAVGGVKVQVKEEDAERAVAVLKEQLAARGDEEIDEEELARQALAERPEEDVPHVPVEPTAVRPDIDPATSDAPSERDEYARRFLLASVFGLIFFPLSFYSCYLFLNAAFGAGRISSEGSRRILFGVMAGAFTVPFWWFMLTLGDWGVIEALTPDW